MYTEIHLDVFTHSSIHPPPLSIVLPHSLFFLAEIINSHTPPLAFLEL